MLGVVPAAGAATRLHPLGFSKELLPIPGRRRLVGVTAFLAGKQKLPSGQPSGEIYQQEEASLRLRAVSECLIERMLLAGADRICIVFGPSKSDLVRFYAGSPWASRLFFASQPEPRGLCDALFQAAPYVNPDETVLLGLPDTIWFPEDAFLPRRDFSVPPQIRLITFPVDRPEDFDAVECGPATGPFGIVRQVAVKSPGGPHRRIWGAITAPGREFLGLHRLWQARQGADRYLGTLINAWIADGNDVIADPRGTGYWDVGTPEGYVGALAALTRRGSGPIDCPLQFLADPIAA